MTKLWKSDDELFALVQRELFTSVVGDVMDKLDLQHQFLPPQIQPLRQDMVVLGRAMPKVRREDQQHALKYRGRVVGDFPVGKLLK